MKTIYLCGPIQDRSDAECTNWRNQAELLWRELHGGTVLDPLRRDYRDRINAGHEIDAGQLVTDDLKDIDDSDGLLVMFDQPSVGTSMEIFYAALPTVRRPIVVLDRRPDKSRPLSPWLTHHVDVIIASGDMVEGLGTLHKLIQRNAR